jgi:hypothetical protein
MPAPTSKIESPERFFTRIFVEACNKAGVDPTDTVSGYNPVATAEYIELLHERIREDAKRIASLGHECRELASCVEELEQG